MQQKTAPVTGTSKVKSTEFKRAYLITDPSLFNGIKLVKRRTYHYVVAVDEDGLSVDVGKFKHPEDAFDYAEQLGDRYNWGIQDET